MQCIKGEDKIIILPILEWTTRDVWQFIKSKIGFWCELYDNGFRRIGCVACPNTYYKMKRKALSVSPRFEYAYKKAIQKCINKGNYQEFEGVDDVWDWWISGQSQKKYLAYKKQLKLAI